MSCSVYLFIIVFLLNVQYHKFSYTFTPRNPSAFSTHDIKIRDTIVPSKQKVLRSQIDTEPTKSTEDLTAFKRPATKVKTKVPDVCNETYSRKSQNLLRRKHRKKRSKRQHFRSDSLPKEPRRRFTTVKEINFLYADNTTREARQILKANILELIDLKPTTTLNIIENDPYIHNDIEPYDVNDADKKNRMKSLVNTDDETAVIDAPDIAPKKSKRTELLNDIEDNFGVEYYSDQKSPLIVKTAESNEDSSIVGASLNEPKAQEHLAPMEATANIYYEDSSTCDQDTWQTIALRYMHDARASGLRTRKTWKFNLKQQTSRTTDTALVQRLYRGYNDQRTPYSEQSLFHKNFEGGSRAISFRRKPQKLKTIDDDVMQYDNSDEGVKDDNVLKVTEIKEYETIMGPVPAPEIEIHTLPMQTALTYQKYKETSETLLPYTETSPPTSIHTERLWVYSLKKYATRSSGAITNTYLLTNSKQYATTTNEPTAVEKSQLKSTLYTFEKIKAHKIKQAEERKKEQKNREAEERKKLQKIKEADVRKKAQKLKEAEERKKAYEMKESEDEKKTYKIKETQERKQSYKTQGKKAFNIEEPDEMQNSFKIEEAEEIKTSYKIDEPVERKRTYKTEEPEPANGDSRKKLPKGGKGPGNDWLYDVNDPDQVAYEMKVTEEYEDDFDIRIYARPMQQTNIQRRWTFRETTVRLSQPPVEHLATSSSHTMKSWMDYFKKCTVLALRLDMIKSNPVAPRETDIVKYTSLIEELINIEADPVVETADICEINDETRSAGEGAKMTESIRLEYALRTMFQALMNLKYDLMWHDKSMERIPIVNQKLKCVPMKLIRT